MIIGYGYLEIAFLVFILLLFSLIGLEIEMRKRTYTLSPIRFYKFSKEYHGGKTGWIFWRYFLIAYIKFSYYQIKDALEKKRKEIKYTTPPEVIKFINRNTVNPPL